MNNYFIKDDLTFCPYLMTSYPDEKIFFSMINILINKGAKIIEFGIPFSDPSADGPVLTAINHEMAEKGKTFEYYLGLISKVKIKYPKIGICVMCYLNPILQYGTQKFFDYLVKNKIDSFLIPDLPIEEYSLLKKIPGKLSNVMVISDNLDNKSLIEISSKTKGYLYVLSSVSITGTKKDYQEKLNKFIIRLKKLCPNKKLVVGFGIKNKEDIDFLRKINVDGFIVGTGLVEAYKKGGINGYEEYINILV